MAQGLTGQISGVVTDSGGGVLPGATVVHQEHGHQSHARNGDRRRWLVRVSRSARRQVRHHRHGRAGSRRTSRRASTSASTERVALRAIALEVGGVAETVTVQAEAVQVQTTNGARSGLITRDNIEDIALKGRDFAGMLKLLPGVIDTSEPRSAGLGQHGRPVDQRPRLVQLLVRRRHQQGHRLEQRQLRGAGARFDRRSPRADVELPGRVRPQLRRDDHRRHAQRVEGLPRQRGVLQARRRAERERVHRQAAVRGRPDGAVQAAATTRSTTRRGRSAGRS